MSSAGLRDLGRLRVFVEVASLGSFSAAADVLGYSQSAVSQQVAGLERELGVALFDRARRPVGLTAAGETLRRHASGLLAQADRAAAAMSDTTGHFAHVRLSAFHSASTTLVSDALERLARDRPEVLVTVLDLHPDSVLATARAKEVDFALIFHDPEDPEGCPPDLACELLLTDRLVAVVPRDRARPPAPIALSDLAEEPWIVPSRTGSGGVCRRLTERAFAQARIDPRIVAESDNYQITQEMVAQGRGVAIVPELSVTGARHANVAVGIEDADVTRGVSAAWAADTPPLAQARIVLGAVHRAAGLRGRQGANGEVAGAIRASAALIGHQRPD